MDGVPIGLTTGYVFDFLGLRELKSSRDFDTEWIKLIDAIAHVTGLDSLQTRHFDAADAARSLLNATMTWYDTEDDFQTALFEALREALGGFCNSSSSSTTNTTGEDSTMRIKLTNSNVGFARDVHRVTNLGFSESYGLFPGSMPDLACVAYRENGTMDTTAIVGVKLSDTSCAEFDMKAPDLDDRHFALAQALLHTIDVWHCLARRGFSTEPGISLPLAILAARRNGKTDSPKGLCGVEARLELPTNLGGDFTYGVDQCISFPSKTRQEADADKDADAHQQAEQEQFKQALAIFIKTLQFGVRQAQKLLSDESRSATTLCCSSPIPDVERLASPIPGAKLSSNGWKIGQGELFRFTGENKSIQDWLRSKPFARMEHLVFANPDMLMDDCLIKISCKSVHTSLVAPSDNLFAFRRLHAKWSKEAKHDVSNVLLACAYASTKCIVAIMKDRSPLSIKEHPVHGKITMAELWRAFDNLVHDVLLPMARENIVHADIRFDPRIWCMRNVLYTKDEQGQTKLVLLDFESLSLCNNALDNVVQDFAVSALYIAQPATAHTLLFWQILYAAYVWSTVPVPAAIDESDDDEIVSARGLKQADTFCYNLFTQKEVVDDSLAMFPQRLGVEVMSRLHTSWDRLLAVEYEVGEPATIDGETECVEEILEILLLFFTTEVKC